MKTIYDLEMPLRKEGKWVKGKALTLAKLLLDHGAEPTRLLESEFDYAGLRVCIPAKAADYIVALLMYLGPGPLGRPPRELTKESTSYARSIASSGKSQRSAAKIVAKITGEKPETIRGRLVARKKTRPKRRSPKPR
jgi:hypothetical protein